MLNRLKYFVKYNKTIYKLYKMFGNIFVKGLSLIFRPNDKWILFVVYGGQRYDDSPKNIYEYMKNDDKFKNYKMIWAFINPKDIKEDIDYKIKIDSLKYYKTALKCKYWITNSSVERGLDFCPKETKVIFCSHGQTGIKKIGVDYIGEEYKKSKRDIILLQGTEIEKKIIKRAWCLDKEILLTLGLPRNDELVDKDKEKINTLKNKMGIPLNKKIILYAPTFREQSRDKFNNVFLKPPFDFKKWEKELGNEYVLLLTAHYEVAKLMDIPINNKFILNAFKYPHINDLILVSDLLISDYSSIIFDYSITEKPILCYGYDYDEYKTERGLYKGYEELFNSGIIKSEDDLIEYIKQMNYEDECIQTKKRIKDKYISNYGDATKKVVNYILEEVLNNE